jgi:hypothetical protein
MKQAGYKWLTTIIVVILEPEIKRIVVRGQLGKKAKPYLKNSQPKKSWQYGSSGRVPAYQTRGTSTDPAPK